jgi:hypothetical protein
MTFFILDQYQYSFVQSTELEAVCTLLGYYAVLIGSQLPVFQVSLLVPSSRIKQSIMGPVGCPDMLVTISQRWLTSQKSEDLISTTMEAWNHATTGVQYQFM